MQGTGIFGLFAALVLVTLVPALEGARRRVGCRGLARYNVTFIGLWSPEDFPKQYPVHRPHAQWSKTVGRTHGPHYSLFKVGEMCTDGIKEFSELGTTTILDNEPQGANDLFDLFTLPPIIKKGVGSTSGRVFLNGKHSKVSLAVKLIPSPDWFTGVSEVDLCSGNRWRPSYSVEVAPMDAGTDRGYTYTAPNWPTIPQRPISVITAQEPHHPANSFFYPERQELSPIARIEFTKVAEYTVGKILREDPMWQNDAAKEEDDESGDENVLDELPVKQTLASTTPKPPRKANRKFRNRQRQRLQKQGSRNRYEDEEEAEIEDAIEDAEEQGATADCIVSDWTAWGPCSKTCGFGSRVRSRTMIQRARGYGRPCPSLVENELCGSMRTCNWNHFSGFKGFSFDRNRGSK